MDKVVHFEIPVDDAERARGFYGSVFDWQLQPMEGYDYTLAITTALDEERGPRSRARSTAESGHEPPRRRRR